MPERNPSGRPWPVALTFDAEHPDRPAEAGATERLADELARLDVHATFFVQGRWAEAYPGVARELASAGHLIGNHSHYHARVPLLTAMGLRADVRAAEGAIGKAMGIDPRPWFRLPFGAGAHSQRVLDRLSTLGYRHVGWTIAPDDWEPDRTASIIETHVVDAALGADGPSIVLLHGWPNGTWSAMAGIVGRLRDAGAALVRIDELSDEAIVTGIDLAARVPKLGGRTPTLAAPVS
jgi:peptidoglycan/xylan/chitin deacetylase (PgdA/CDA1 family)